MAVCENMYDQKICTIIVLERAFCSTRSILTSSFCTVALLGMMIELFLGRVKVKGKVFYGQEPPSGESTTSESGVNYQLLSVMH